ncbi:hypothetical protein D3C76_1202570 [compost metagenome]
MRGDQGAVRAVGVERHQGSVKPGLVMGACDFFHIVGLQDGAATRMDFRGMVTADVADEFDTHGSSLSWEGHGSSLHLAGGRSVGAKVGVAGCDCEMPIGSKLIMN